MDVSVHIDRGTVYHPLMVSFLDPRQLLIPFLAPDVRGSSFLQRWVIIVLQVVNTDLARMYVESTVVPPLPMVVFSPVMG
jgi:hypothetical protein